MPLEKCGGNAKAIGNSVTLSFLRSSISVSQKQVTKQLIDLAVRHCKSNVKHYNWRSDTNELLSTLETAKAVTPILDLMSFISSLNIKGFIVSDSNRLANLYYMSTTKEEKDKILNLALVSDLLLSRKQQKMEFRSFHGANPKQSGMEAEAESKNSCVAIRKKRFFIILTIAHTQAIG